MLLFGAVIFGFRSTSWQPGIDLRMGAGAALSVTVIAFIFQVIPVGEVAKPLLVAAKVIGAIAATNGLVFSSIGGELCARSSLALEEI
jgi:hypothetical protein